MTKVCLQLIRNKNLYYNREANEPSIYPTVFEAGEISELQELRVSGLYNEITKIPKITAEKVSSLKTIRASSLVHYGNTFSKKIQMWDKHILSPNFKPVDTDATNIGSFIHLLFEHSGNPPLDTFIKEDWGTKTRTSVKFDKLREKYGYDLPIVNSEEYIKYTRLYDRAHKEINDKIIIGESKEQIRHTIPNYLGTGWSFSGSIDRVHVTEEGYHDITDIKSVEPNNLHEWENGSYSLAYKFLQLEGYRMLYHLTYGVPLERIRVKFLLIIRSISNEYLGKCVRLLIPKVQHTEQKKEQFENMFRDIAAFLEDRINNKPLELEEVKYNPITVKVAFNFQEYNEVFDALQKLCASQDIRCLEGEDYFNAGEFKVVTYKLLINILRTMGYLVNVETVRVGDVIEYITNEEGNYEKRHKKIATPDAKVLYYSCEIIDMKSGKIIKIDSLTDSDVQEYAKMFSYHSRKYYWGNFYEQMANVTVIKHGARSFIYENKTLETFLKLEQLTYEGLKNND